MQGFDDLTVVIQAGGESRRMGRSKATVPFLGKPLICRGIHRLAELSDELVITTNEPENLAFTYDLEEVQGKTLILQPDLLETRGALNGLFTALKTATREYVAIVACDMIFASPSLISAEVQALRDDPTLDAVVPVTKSGFEPFHSTYRRASSLEKVEAAIAAGQTRANSWFGDASLLEFDQERVLEADPRGGCFMNVNTPEELARMEERISGRMMKTIDGSCKDD